MLRPDQIAVLEGLPAHWRFMLTGNEGNAKRGFESGWNHPDHGRTLADVLRINSNPDAGERWISRKMIGVGAITGPESNGLLVLDFDGKGSEAVRAFRAHFRHYPSDLPATLANQSGKKGRAKLFFHVPPHWWPQLENLSASWRTPDGRVALEAIWQSTTGNSRQAVICGDHPDSSHQTPLWYRWLDGRSPSDVAVAEAPEWLLLGIVAQIQSYGEASIEKARTGEDDASPWERLTSWERRELVESALPFCPNRLSRGSGTYEQVRRVMCGVLNEFGLETAKLILCDSEWDRKNEWDGTTDCGKTLESLAKSKVAEDHKSRIASVFYFAREAGWECPPWATPAVETKVYIEGLKKLINQSIQHYDDKTAFQAFCGKAKREFGIDVPTFRQLGLEQYLGGGDRTAMASMTEISNSERSDNLKADVIDGFLGRRVHVLVGASHSGKTTLACFLTNRVVNGVPLDVDSTRHSVERKGRVLIFTSDCSNRDMIRDLSLEGVDTHTHGEQVRICSGVTFDNMLFIVKALTEFTPDLVIYDCLSSMACMGTKIGEPSYADPIRLLVRHNGIAWPAAAHVILHHTSRDEPARYSGTEQIKAASEELWLYYPPELLKWKKGGERPKVGPSRHLVMEKSRTGYAGRTMILTRNAFRGEWSVRRPYVDDVPPLEFLAEKFRAWTRDQEWRIASEWQKELDLPFAGRSLRRYLEALDGTLLDHKRQRSRITGRLDTHYRPRQVVMDAAIAMTTSPGDGVNVV